MQKSLLKCPPTVIKKYKIETQFNESQEMFDRLLWFTPLIMVDENLDGKKRKKKKLTEVGS